jgi:serine/threonine-protein kinase
MKLCPKCHKQFSDDANFCPVDAARLAPLESQSVAADTITAKFDLGDRLGGARTGSVHRAVDKATGQPAVVKIIAPAVVAVPGLAQRLERELKQLERVQSAGVAKVLASGKRGDDTWVALELLDGAQTLSEAISARGPIALELAAHLVEVIGEALIEAAQVGVVHRDLAPKNVLFAGDDIKLINFSLPVPGDKVPGVAEFVAPEQADGKPVDQRSNLYSLGALYYYVLTGQPVQHDEAGAVRPPSALAVVPPAVEAVIVRALDRSPTKRFLTVRQFVDEVGRVARGEADPKSTQAMGRAGKPRAELVQTLLGVRGAGLTSAIAAVAPPPGLGAQTLIDPDPLPGAQTIPEPPPNHAQTLIDPLPPAHVIDTPVPAQIVGGVRGAPSTFAGVAAPPITSTPSSAPAMTANAGPGAPTLIGPAMPDPLPPQAVAPGALGHAPQAMSLGGPQMPHAMSPGGPQMPGAMLPGGPQMPGALQPPSAGSAAPQALSGAPHGLSGSPQALSGSSQALSGSPQALSGAPHGLSGSPQAPSGAPQGLSGAPHGLSGSPQALSGSPPALSGSPQALSPERSPWAPPATGSADPTVPAGHPAAVMAPPAMPAAAAAMAPPAMPAAATVPAAPVVPAPVLAAPVLPASTSGKKAKGGGESKGKFRETMWFKKGELDAQAAEAAAQEIAKTGKATQDKADLLPIDERYKDDGTLSRSDKEKYSLRTGATMMTAAVRDSASHSHLGKVSEDALIDEMKGGRNKIFALIGIGLVILILIIVLLVR